MHHGCTGDTSAWAAEVKIALDEPQLCSETTSGQYPMNGMVNSQIAYGKQNGGELNKNICYLSLRMELMDWDMAVIAHLFMRK